MLCFLPISLSLSLCLFALTRTPNDGHSPPHDGYVHDGQGSTDDNSPVRHILSDAHRHACRQRHDFHLQKTRRRQDNDKQGQTVWLG